MHKFEKEGTLSIFMREIARQATASVQSKVVFHFEGGVLPPFTVREVLRGVFHPVARLEQTFTLYVELVVCRKIRERSKTSERSSVLFSRVGLDDTKRLPWNVGDEGGILWDGAD